MKILFFIRHLGYVRNFEAFLVAAAERGHDVHVAVGAGRTSWLAGRENPLERIASANPGITYGPAPVRSDRFWAQLLRDAGMAVDYLRYREPEYAGAPKLRRRAEKALPPRYRSVMETPLAQSKAGRAALRRFFRTLEQAAPPAPEVDEFIRAQAPDIVLVTPLVDFQSLQPDYIRAAKRLGIRTGLCVASWDNLTNKGLIRDVPDIVTVWNEPQREEAIALHGLPPAKVVATGAHTYDHWFSWAPSTTAEEFVRKVGLPTGSLLLLYLCSSPFIAPNEVPFVRRWLDALRSHPDPRLAEAAVLIRPHPQNGKQWQDVEFSPADRAAIWPPAGADPVDAQARSEFYDSIYHAKAVVGVNTSALIESAIVNRPVFTLKAPDFRETQDGTLHFEHLVSVNGGMLRVAETYEEHTAQLLEALDDDADQQRQNRRFLEAFVRPHGLDRAAATILVETIERAAAAPAPAPARPSPSALAARQLLLRRRTKKTKKKKRGKRRFSQRARRLPRQARRVVTHRVLPGAGAVRRRLSRLR
jgi:hypothetical protein